MPKTRVIAIRVDMADYYDYLSKASADKKPIGTWLNDVIRANSIKKEGGFVNQVQEYNQLKERCKNLEAECNQLKLKLNPPKQIQNPYKTFIERLPKIKYAKHWSQVGRDKWKEEREALIEPIFRRYESKEISFEDACELINRTKQIETYGLVD